MDTGITVLLSPLLLMKNVKRKTRIQSANPGKAAAGSTWSRISGTGSFRRSIVNVKNDIGKTIMENVYRHLNIVLMHYEETLLFSKIENVDVKVAM
jgi:hypothetical protein